MIVGLITAFALGCASRTAPPGPSQQAAPNQQATAPGPSQQAAPNQQATELATQIREAMTTPEIMRQEVGPRFGEHTGRGRSQIQAALPLMRELVDCGNAAEEPLWQLINDEDQSVRHSIVILLNPRNYLVQEVMKPNPSQNFIDLNIPLLERVLSADDPVARFYACSGLGDAPSNECLERLKTSLPKIRELRNDNEEQVRRIAYHAYNNILTSLARQAKTPEDRKAAAEEWEQFSKEGPW